MKAMSFNLRFATDADGENAWRFRKDLVIATINRHHPDLFGVQEATHGQMAYMIEHLPAYGSVGVGRDDGGEHGEYSAIFYQTAAQRCRRTQTFWLSETPDQVGSLGWDANNIRICTWGEFEDANGTLFYFFNTHLDHIGQEAQTEGAKLIMHRIERIADDRPVILTGDFNCTPNSDPYRIIGGGDPSIQDLRLADARALSQTEPTGPAWTFHGFHPPGQIIIDYIFVRNVVAVTAFHTLDDNWDGRYPSDHLPVLAELVL